MLTKEDVQLIGDEFDTRLDNQFERRLSVFKLELKAELKNELIKEIIKELIPIIIDLIDTRIENLAIMIQNEFKTINIRLNYLEYYINYKKEPYEGSQDDV